MATFRFLVAIVLSLLVGLLLSLGKFLDLYVEWAKLVTDGHTDARASREYSAGMIALRPDQDGRIAGYEGLDEVRQQFASNIIDTHMPPPGSASSTPATARTTRRARSRRSRASTRTASRTRACG